MIDAATSDGVDWAAVPLVAAFVFGVLLGAIVVVRLVRYLTNYLRHLDRTEEE